MRILQVHNHYQQAGGEDVVAASERRLLTEAGHSVDGFIVHNDTIQSLPDRLAASFRVVWSRPSYEAVRARIRSFRPDVVHVHNFFPLISPSVFDACRAEGAPVVMTLHNYRLICPGALLLRRDRICEKCVAGSPYWGAVHRCYRGSALGSLAVATMVDVHRRRGTWHKKVDRLIALTEFARGKFIEAGLPAGKIVVKPNFVEDPVQPGERLDGPRHGALFVGRLSPEKGVQILIDAWKGVNYPLRIVGTGPLEAEIRGKAPENVSFLGQCDRMRVDAEMRRAAFLVMPSTWYEGLPMTLVEAFAWDLPVVASRIGALEELVEEQATGLTFEAGNPADLRRAAYEMITRPIPRGNCRRYFFNHYSAAANLARLEAIYRGVNGAYP
ncbi:glycosyltransferase [Benzoatithermus flavus]|uniref:Glycosyltransferase n=1 Tax=Benzoatithermus flavus TaxID=3108223 RepID=A0ABU8XSV4_9PROT